MGWKMMYDVCICVSEYRKSRLDSRLWLLGCGENIVCRCRCRCSMPWVRATRIHFVSEPKLFVCMHNTRKNPVLSLSANEWATAAFIPSYRVSVHCSHMPYLCTYPARCRSTYPSRLNWEIAAFAVQPVRMRRHKCWMAHYIAYMYETYDNMILPATQRANHNNRTAEGEDDNDNEAGENEGK